MAAQELDVRTQNAPPEAWPEPAAAGLFYPVSDPLPERRVAHIDGDTLRPQAGLHNLVAPILLPVSPEIADAQRRVRLLVHCRRIITARKWAANEGRRPRHCY